MNSILVDNQNLVSMLIIVLILSSSNITIQGENEIDEPVLRSIILFTPKELDEFSQWHAKSKSTQLWLNAISAGLYDISYEEDDDLYLPDTNDYYQYYHLNIAVDYPNFINKTTFQVEIKDDIRFSDGELMTVEDVIFSYQVALSPSINKKSYNLFSRYFDSNDSIVIVDKNIIEFQMNQEYLFYFQLLDLNIIPKSQYIGDMDVKNYYWNDETGRYAVGAGPYRVEQINLDRGEIILLKNTYNKYWEDPHSTWGNAVVDNFDKIIVKHAASKELAIQLSLEEYRSAGKPIFDPYYNFTTYDRYLLDQSPDYYYSFPEPTKTMELSYNHHHPILGTGENLSIIEDTDKLSQARDIRKAISLAIRRDNVTHTVEFSGDEHKVLHGGSTSYFKPKISTTGYNFPELLYYYHDGLSYDSAKYMMSSVGFNYNNLEMDDAGKYTNSFFNVSLTVLNHPRYTIIAEAIKSDLREIGIGISPIVAVSEDEYSSLLRNSGPIKLYDEGGFDVIIQEIDWGLIFDPTEYYHSNSTFDRRIYNYNDPELDEFIDSYTSSLGSTNVNRSYHELLYYVNTTEISTPLYYTTYHFVFFDEIIINPLEVITFHLNWEEVYIDVTSVEIANSSTSTNQFDFEYVILTIPILYIAKKKWKIKDYRIGT